MKIRSQGVIMAVLALTAFLLCLLLTNRVGDSWEQRIREGLYRIQGKTIPDFAPVYYDERNIPFAVYAAEHGIEPGKQYNATLVANHALELYDKLKQGDSAASTSFWHQLHWLDSAMTFLNDTTAIYRFRWRQAWYPEVGSPFSSGMSSGRALEAFTAAFRLSGDSIWLRKGLPLVAGFGVPKEGGGFAIPNADGVWYEEFADSSGPTPRVLDGHIYALLGLKSYSEASKSDLAARYYQYGMLALVRDLPAYDAGSGSVYYDAQGKKADKKYHRLIVSQLEDLYRIAGQEACRMYAEKWKQPLLSPYVWRMLQEGNRSGLLLFVLAWAGFFALLLVLMRIWFSLRNAKTQ